MTPGAGSDEAQVAVDDHLAGVIVMADELRPHATGIVARPRSEGIRHVAMISGDRGSIDLAVILNALRALRG